MPLTRLGRTLEGRDKPEKLSCREGSQENAHDLFRRDRSFRIPLSWFWELHAFLSGVFCFGQSVEPGQAGGDGPRVDPERAALHHHAAG